MYYVSILHRVPYTTVEYTTETYFIDEVAADNWIDKIFMLSNPAGRSSCK